MEHIGLVYRIVTFDRSLFHTVLTTCGDWAFVSPFAVGTCVAGVAGGAAPTGPWDAAHQAASQEGELRAESSPEAPDAGRARDADADSTTPF